MCSLLVKLAIKKIRTTNIRVKRDGFSRNIRILLIKNDPAWPRKLDQRAPQNLECGKTTSVNTSQQVWTVGCTGVCLKLSATSLNYGNAFGYIYLWYLHLRSGNWIYFIYPTSNIKWISISQLQLPIFSGFFNEFVSMKYVKSKTCHKNSCLDYWVQFYNWSHFRWEWDKMFKYSG